MTTLEILEAARALIAEPEHWCQGAQALDATGTVRRPCSRLAVRWCSLGATDRVTRYKGIRADNALYSALGMPPDIGIANFNDSHTHAEVLDLFDRAIAAERAKAVLA